MRECALGWEGKPTSSKAECNLVAGSSLGLYNGLSCTNPPCRANKIDVLYRHAWHYFNYIYLPDAAGDLLRNLEILEDSDIEDLSHLVESMKHIRNLGAHSLTRYYSSDTFINSISKALKNKKLHGIWEELYDTFLQHPEKFEATNQGGDSYQISYSDAGLRFDPQAFRRMHQSRGIHDLLEQDHPASPETECLAAALHL
jgi:hypothetical protein